MRGVWRCALLAAVLLAAGGGAEGSVATGKEAFFSPLRPVIPTHLPRFAFRSRPGGPRTRSARRAPARSPALKFGTFRT